MRRVFTSSHAQQVRPVKLWKGCHVFLLPGPSPHLPPAAAPLPLLEQRKHYMSAIQYRQNTNTIATINHYMLVWHYYYNRKTFWEFNFSNNLNVGSLTKTFLVQPGPDLIRSTPHTGMSLSRLGALSFLFKGKMRAQEGNVCSATPLMIQKVRLVFS